MASQSRNRQKKQAIADGRISLPPPRNPVAQVARQRKAGAHRKSASGTRQQQQKTLRKTLAET